MKIRLRFYVVELFKVLFVNRKTHYLFLSLVLSMFSSSLFCANQIEIIQMEQSKYNVNAKLRITSPNVLKKNSPILFLVSNFPIGVDVRSAVMDEMGVPINRHGSRVLIAFSNGQRMYVTKDDVNLLVTQRSYFNKRFRVKVPNRIYEKIQDTDFAMYSMLVNCYGECIKHRNAYYVDVYSYLKEHKGIEKIKAGLKQPYIIGNEPYGRVKRGAILLDFFLKNANLSVNEYKLDIYMDGKKLFRVYSWDPYVLKNVPPGQHTLKLELIDPSGNVVRNFISKDVLTFYVE